MSKFIPSSPTWRIALLAVISFAFFEGTAAFILVALDLREGHSLYETARNRYGDLRLAWTRPSYYGSFDPMLQVRHVPGESYRGLLINQHGFIGNDSGDPALEAFPEKPLDLYRIVLLGGSSAAGLGVSDNRETIASQLERQLNADAGTSAVRYQVLNFGAAGGYSGAEVTKFLLQLVHLHPDMVISLDGFNDAWNAVLEHYRVGLPHGVVNWSDYSYHLFETLNGYARPGTAPPPKVPTFAVTLINRMRTSRWRPTVQQGLYAEYPWYIMSGQISRSDPVFGEALRANLNAMGAYAAMNPEVALIAYLQPHAHQWKPLTAGERKRLEEWHALYADQNGSAFAWEQFRGTMLPAFKRYAAVYRQLSEQYADAENVAFVDLRRLFEEEQGEVYVDNIHYTARGNSLLAGRMAEDILGVRRAQQRRLATP